MEQVVLELFVSLSHEKQLYRESVPLRIIVKQRQEWIIIELLQKQIRPVFLSQHRTEGRLSRPYIPFNDNIVVWYFQLQCLFNIYSFNL